MAVVEGENVLHHVKREGNIRAKQMSRGMDVLHSNVQYEMGVILVLVLRRESIFFAKICAKNDFAAFPLRLPPTSTVI